MLRFGKNNCKNRFVPKPLTGALAAFICLLAPSQQALSVQEGVPFGAAVDIRHYCQILVWRTGTITSRPDFLELSSKQAGGITGRAMISTTNASFSVVSVDAPTTFTSMPTNGDTGVSFTATYFTSGATTTAETAGTSSTRLGRGNTMVDVHLVADRVGTVFPAGNYTAEVTVRCE